MKNVFDVHAIVRPHLKNLKPYASARDDFKGEAEIMLDANENPNPNTINRYPDPLQSELKSSIGLVKNIPPENIFLGNGSDEPIDLLIRAFCEPKEDQILITPPTYGMYKVTASIHNIGVLEAPLLPNFDLNVNDLAEKLPKAKITFLCSPNNPSGNTLNLKQLEEWAEICGGLIIIDEAYIDFCPEKSVLQKVNEIPNLVVLQTFSKAMGAAGIRLGMAFAQQPILNVLNSIKPPYNINQLTINKASEILEKITFLKKQTKTLISERKKLEDNLKSLPYVSKIFPSEANFLLIKFNDAQWVKNHLEKNGIIVRDRSNQLHCDGCLRISVGTEEENLKLSNLLKGSNL